MSTLRQAAPRSHIGLQHAMSVEAVYPADPAAVPQARHLVTKALRDWGLASMRLEAETVTAELTANAVGQETRPAEILFRVSWTDRYLVVQVGDHNPAGPPRPPRRVRSTEEHGRGLLITRALSAHLAWFRQGDWKIVWAALPKPAAPGQQERGQGQFGVAA